MQLPLSISAEVAAGLAAKQPLVALESTLITHGLPFPLNLETALAMESAARAAGAIPATIALLGGDVTVGISAAQLERLAKAPAGSVRKCSRRDLPICIARRQDGATTVAATMIIAEQAGIKIFATGGIGGVHRGQPQDVSADLTELGQTPVAVVCSGAKAILDLPLTLEVLETNGVPVLGYQTDSLPAFYSATSDLPIDERVDSPAEAAAILKTAAAIGARQGMLIAVPVPAAHELPAARVDGAIAKATREAEAAGIAGKDITPFVLARVSALTGGASMAANIELLINNARVAGEIALALSQL